MIGRGRGGGGRTTRDMGRYGEIWGSCGRSGEMFAYTTLAAKWWTTNASSIVSLSAVSICSPRWSSPVALPPKNWLGVWLVCISRQNAESDGLATRSWESRSWKAPRFFWSKMAHTCGWREETQKRAVRRVDAQTRARTVAAARKRRCVWPRGGVCGHVAHTSALSGGLTSGIGKPSRV